MNRSSADANSTPRTQAKATATSRTMASDRVCEWVARKSSHAADPFSDVQSLPPPTADGMGAASAVVANRVVANSTRIQRANNRVYFPVADCDVAAFTLSDKRWR